MRRSVKFDLETCSLMKVLMLESLHALLKLFCFNIDESHVRGAEINV